MELMPLLREEEKKKMGGGNFFKKNAAVDGEILGWSWNAVAFMARQAGIQGKMKWEKSRKWPTCLVQCRNRGRAARDGAVCCKARMYGGINKVGSGWETAGRNHWSLRPWEATGHPHRKRSVEHQ